MSDRRRAVVCLKQVPVPEAINFDARTKRVLRDGEAAITNPSDLAALGHGLALATTGHWEVIAVTMGPEGAQYILRNALAHGADRAIHLQDRRFAGADTLATARALAKVIEREKADLVLTGHRTLDGGTGQVGPQIAELLGLPVLTGVTDLRPGHFDHLDATVETDAGSETWATTLPAVMSVRRGPLGPAGLPELGPAAIQTLTADELSDNPREFGTRGSPTFVAEIRPANKPRCAELICDTTEAVEQVAALIDAAPTQTDAALSPPHFDHLTGAAPQAQREIWVIVEQLSDGTIHRTSLEGLACARSVATTMHAATVAVIPCGPMALTYQPHVLWLHGADRVLALVGDSLTECSADCYVQHLSEALANSRPIAVIAPFSAKGRDYLPRIAARLQLGLTGDFTALEVRGADSDDPDLLWLKPALSRAVSAAVIARTTPSLGTLRPGSFPPLMLRREGAGPAVEMRRVGPPTGSRQPHRTDEHIDGSACVRLASSPVVVGIGNEVSPPTAVLARRLVAAIGAALGATSAGVAAGQAPPQLEIGPTALSIAPALYLGVGHHDHDTLQCVRDSATVALIDPAADAGGLGSLADVLVIADTAAVLSGLIRRANTHR